MANVDKIITELTIKRNSIKAEIMLNKKMINNIKTDISQSENDVAMYDEAIKRLEGASQETAEEYHKRNPPIVGFLETPFEEG